MWSGGTAPIILNLGTRWSEWSGFRSDRFMSRENFPDAHCARGWVGPAPVWGRENSLLLPGTQPRLHGRPIHSLVTLQTTLHTI